MVTLGNEALEREFLKKLNRKAGRLSWGGWTKDKSDNEYFPWKKEEDFRVHIVGLKTLLPRLLLKIEIRLIGKAKGRYSRLQEFNPKEDDFVFDLRITDELNRFERIRILTIIRHKGEKDVDLLERIFEKAKKKAIFTDLGERRRKNEKFFLKKVLNIF